MTNGDQEAPRAVYREDGGVHGLENLLDGTPQIAFDLSNFARQIYRVMIGVPTKSIGQHTPEEMADHLVERGAFTRQEIEEIFEAFGYTGFDNFPEKLG